MLQWFHDRWNDFVDLLYVFLLTLRDILLDMFYFLVDVVMTAGLVLFESFAVALQKISLAPYMSALPQEVAAILGMLQVAEMLSVVISCLLIRLILQFIPFTRLGS